MFDLLADCLCNDCGSAADVDEVQTSEDTFTAFCPRCLVRWRDGNDTARLWRRLRSSRMRNVQRAALASRLKDRAEGDRYTADVLAMFATDDEEREFAAFMNAGPWPEFEEATGDAPELVAAAA